jgi:hypothetical protein
MNTLNIDQVRQLAPAAFSISPDSSLSDSYSHVTTVAVLDALQQDGWQITDARQARSRGRASMEHRKHEISLTHPLLPTHAEGAPLLRISNSSDGCNALRTIGGFLRWACTNQLYTGVKVVGGVFYHRGGSLEDRVVAGAREARNNFDRVIAAVDLWKQIELSPKQQQALVLQGLKARWPVNTPHTLFEEVLTPRRNGDDGRDLWSTFNRVQESLVRGGFLAGFTQRDDQGNELPELQVRRVRKITGLTANERINTQLWELASAVAAGEEVLA